MSLYIIMLSVTFLIVRLTIQTNITSNIAVTRNATTLGIKCRYVKCRYSECRGAVNTALSKLYQLSPLIEVLDQPEGVAAVVPLRRKRQQHGQREVGFQAGKKEDALLGGMGARRSEEAP